MLPAGVFQAEGMPPAEQQPTSSENRPVTRREGRGGGGPGVGRDLSALARGQGLRVGPREASEGLPRFGFAQEATRAVGGRLSGDGTEA